MATPGIQVDPSQVQSISVDPSEVQAMPAAATPTAAARPRTWLDSASDYAGGAWDNLVQTGKGMVDLVARTPSTVASIGRAQDNLRLKAEEAFKSGDYATGTRHLLDYLIPVVGPAIDQLGDQAASGQVARALGGATSLGLQLAGPTALARTVPPVQAVTGAAEGAEAAPAATGGILKSRLNPTQQAAVDYLRANDVPLNAGTITGNKFVKGAQALVQNQPLGAGVAATAARATEQGLTRVAGELAEEAHPWPATPESAGAAPAGALKEQIGVLKLREDEAYGDAWQGMNDPQYAESVPIKTQPEAAPVMATVQMPVDVRGIKQQLGPVMDSMSWMPASDQASSAGYQAVRKILAGPDFIPAQAAEQGLSGLKTMARVDNPNLRNTSQGMAAGIIPDLQDGIDAAVAKTGDIALRSLQDGRAYHATKMDIADTADQLREEPVQAFNQLTWRNDTGIGFLRRVGNQAPGVLPQIGRAFVQKLFDQATAEGGFSRAQGLLNQWENLGPQTKQLLYPSPGLRNSLDNFFLGAKMVAENPNPSGTAVVAQLIPGGMLMVHNPVLGTGYLLGGYAAAKLLFSPAGVRLLTGSLRPAASVGAAGMAAAQIMRIAGDDDVTPLEGSGAGGRGPGQEAPGGGSAAPVNPSPEPPVAPGAPAGETLLNPGAGKSTVETPPEGASDGSSAVRQADDDSLPEHDAGGTGGTPPVPSQPGAVAPNQRTTATTIPIPGSERVPYQSKYAVKELADIAPSHNGLSFAPNEGYEFQNDRDYTKVENQSKILNGSMPNQFDPRYFINNGPDMGGGPPAVNIRGHVLGGNGRTMMLQRTYQWDPKGAQAYRDLLMQDAHLYGLDPAQIEGMKQPVLVREIADSELPDAAAEQRAVTDFNAKGTAALRPEEQAMADSRRVTQRTLDDIAERVDALGPDGTLAKVLNGPGGIDVLNHMMQDGAIGSQEAAAYISNGAITEGGKARVAQAVVARYFRDVPQIDRTAPAVRGKLERIAPALANLEGDPKWSLSPTVQSALDLLEEARANGNTLDDFLAHGAGLSKQEYPAPVADMARYLGKGKGSVRPNILADAVRIYGQDAETDRAPEGLWGKPEVPEPAASLNRGVKVATLRDKIARAEAALKKPGLGDADQATGREAIQKMRAALEKL